MGELLIGEQRRERRNRPVGADAFEPGAGGILFRGRRAGLQDADELLFLAGQGRAAGTEKSKHREQERQSSDVSK